MLHLLIIGVNALRGNLGFNPVQTILKHTGRSAVIFLLLSLACTPLHNLLVLPVVRRLRKPLGLYSSLYALIHFSVFAIWDYRLNFALIWSEISNKPFILLGFGATIILLLLAATSFRFWQKKLGVWWSRLHKLVYLAGILIILHFLLAIKGDLFSLQGGYRAPLIAAGTLVVLFLLRIPFIYTPIRRILGREPAARNHP
jgi:sulfoxide reductase heme-binding subunit YedZ